MRYVVLDIEWNVAMHGKTVDYQISEFTAILLDEKIHTVDSFRFLEDRENGYVQAETHFNGNDKINVDDIDAGWMSFIKWLDEKAILLLWDKKTETLVEKCSSKRKSKNP